MSRLTLKIFPFPFTLLSQFSLAILPPPPVLPSTPRRFIRRLEFYHFTEFCFDLLKGSRADSRMRAASRRRAIEITSSSRQIYLASTPFSRLVHSFSPRQTLVLDHPSLNIQSCLIHHR
ncbi:hypothetical protein L1887_06768 [Cichorium endivia]|nr:hypothetical protein L1887_06768 [Cichorium endivia]